MTDALRSREGQNLDFSTNRTVSANALKSRPECDPGRRYSVLSPRDLDAEAGHHRGGVDGRSSWHPACLGSLTQNRWLPGPTWLPRRRRGACSTHSRQGTRPDHTRRRSPSCWRPRDTRCTIYDVGVLVHMVVGACDGSDAVDELRICSTLSSLIRTDVSSS